MLLNYSGYVPICPLLLGAVEVGPPVQVADEPAAVLLGRRPDEYVRRRVVVVRVCVRDTTVLAVVVSDNEVRPDLVHELLDIEQGNLTLTNREGVAGASTVRAGHPDGLGPPEGARTANRRLKAPVLLHREGEALRRTLIFAAVRGVVALLAIPAVAILDAATGDGRVVAHTTHRVAPIFRADVSIIAREGCVMAGAPLAPVAGGARPLLRPRVTGAAGLRLLGPIDALVGVCAGAPLAPVAGGGARPRLRPATIEAAGHLLGRADRALLGGGERRAVAHVPSAVAVRVRLILVRIGGAVVGVVLDAVVVEVGVGVGAVVAALLGLLLPVARDRDDDERRRQDEHGDVLHDYSFPPV